MSAPAPGGEIVTAHEAEEGAGVRVRRLFPVPGRRHHDPFVLWDHFFVDEGAGFPPHPHRGFEAITYLFSGAMRHEDDLGNRSTVAAGGAQRFTAGRGIVHSEMPVGAAEGIQLWINLPQALKGSAPDYQAVPAEAVPQRREGGLTRRILVGEAGPVRLHTPVRYEDWTLAGEATLAVPEGWRGLIYGVHGALAVDGQALAPAQAFLVAGAGERVLSGRGRAMIALGRPWGEPIRQHGPFVD